MCFDYIYPSWLLQDLSPSLPTQPCLSFPPTHSIKSNLYCPYIPGCVAFHSSVVNLPGATVKTDFSSPRRYPLRWLEVGFQALFSSPCQDLVCSELAQCCAGWYNHVSSVCMCTSLLCESEEHSALVFNHHLDLPTASDFLPLSQWYLSLGRRIVMWLSHLGLIFCTLAS